MGKKKSSESTQNTTRNTFPLHTKEKSMKSKTKQLVNRKEIANDFNLDSLECLRDTTQKTKLSGVDEKIKLLKTELQSLLFDKTDNNSKSSTADNLPDVNQRQPKNFECDLPQSGNYGDSSNLQIKKMDFKPASASTPTKFSGRAIEAVPKESLVKTAVQKYSEAKNLCLNSKSDTNVSVHSNSSVYNVSSLSQQKVEQLLYQAFVLQNLELNSALFENSDSESKIVAVQRKEKFQKRKKQSKNNYEKFTQPSLKKYCRSTQKGRKRRMISQTFSESDVEVVTLDSSSYSNAEPKNNITCIDLDLIDCDLNEPFEITEFSPELEIPRTEESPDDQALKLSNTNPMETDVSFTVENEKTILKSGWECPICFEPSKGQKVVATQCGHVFCKKCLKNCFLKSNKSCPTCRTNLKNKPLIPLFNF